MSDPVRWLESPDAPAGAKDLLRAARRVPMSPTVEARSAARVAELVTATTAAASKSVWWKWFAAAGSIGVASAWLVVTVIPRMHPERRAPLVAAVASSSESASNVHRSHDDSVVSFSSTGDGTANAVMVRPPPPMRTIARTIEHAPSDRSRNTDRGRQRQALLEEARRALYQSNDPRRALELARQHARQFPHDLEEEREYITVRALAGLGRSTEARSRGEAFLERYPHGIYVGPMRRFLSTLP